MTPEPYRFGPPGRQLLALHHSPSGEDRAHGVLLCNPFGQEAIRAHRLLRVVAGRLARAGFHVLRFDYFGTGDSDGDDESVTLAGWVEDVLAASAHLERVSGASRVSWAGLGLGASAALLAGSRRPPSRILAWDPVAVGADYVAGLADAHVAALAVELPGTPRPATGMGQGFEILGFPVAPALEAELQALRPDSFSQCRARHVDLVLSPAATHAEALEAALRAGGAQVTLHRIQSRVTWASDEAMNSAIVPADGMDAVMAALEAA